MIFFLEKLEKNTKNISKFVQYFKVVQNLVCSYFYLLTFAAELVIIKYKLLTNYIRRKWLSSRHPFILLRNFSNRETKIFFELYSYNKIEFLEF